MSGYFWTPTAVGDLMSGLVGDVATALKAQAPGGGPGRVVVAPGADVAWDGCGCDGGQLSINVSSGPYRSRTFPNAATDAWDPCDDFMMVFGLSIVLVRCVHISDDNGAVPAAANVTADGVSQATDSYVVWVTLDCALRELQDTRLISHYIVNDQAPLGPLGGCAGTVTNIKIGLIPPCPCQPPV